MLRYILWKYLWLVKIKTYVIEVLAGDSDEITVFNGVVKIMRKNALSITKDQFVD